MDDSVKSQVFSGYDSDETIVDGSFSGSDDEDDLQLKRLLIRHTSLTSLPETLLTNGHNGQLSPEIQPLGTLIKGTQMETVSLRQVCSNPPEDEPSQSLLRKWTKDSSHCGPDMASTRGDTFGEPHVDDICFAGMCEDSQYLINLSEYEVDNSNNESTEISLLTGVIPDQDPYTENELKEEKQIQLSNLEKLSEIYEVKVVNKEPQHSKECRPLITSGNETEKASENGNLACMSFIEENADGSSGLSSEPLNTINSMQIPESEGAQHNIEGDSAIPNEQAMLNNVSSDDDTLISSLASAKEDNDQKTEENERKISLQKTEQEPDSCEPLKGARYLRYNLRYSRCFIDPDQLAENHSLCPGSRKNYTLTINDQNDITDSHVIPSEPVHVNPATERHCSAYYVTGARRSQRVIEKAFMTKTVNEHQPPATPKGLNIVNSTCVPSASQNISDIGKKTQSERINKSSGKKKAAHKSIQSFSYELEKTDKNQNPILLPKTKLNSADERDCSEPKHKYVHGTTSEQVCANRKMAQRRKSEECLSPSASTNTISHSKRIKMHMAGKSQTAQLQKHVKVTNSTKSDKKIDTVLRKSWRLRHRQAECSTCVWSNEFKDTTPSSSKMSFTSQHCSAQSNTKDSVNLHKRDFTGETQLHKAARKGDLALVSALIKAGINVNQSDNAGWTAIHEASCKGNSEIVQVLLEAGANVNSRGADGVLPIHDAVYGNHLKTVKLLLGFGADPYARDNNQQNAFDKCFYKKMKKLLKTQSQVIRMKHKNCMAGSEVMQEVTINSTPAKGIMRSETNSMENITLQETESKQKSLLAAEIHSHEDADKYVEEMCHIQEVLNDIVTQQKNEKDSLAKKYRASVDSFKQGKLRHNVSELANAQKSLLKIVCNQKKVAKKIKAYQQMKRSHSNENGQDLSPCYCAKSPERNPISGLLTHNEGHNASRANGSTIATKMPAVCIMPDTESNEFQSRFMRFISSSAVSGSRDIPVGVLASERTGQQSSNLTFDDIPLGAENGLLGLDPYPSLSPTDLSTVNDHLGSTESGYRSPYSVLVNGAINVTDNSNVTYKLNHQTTDKRQQISEICQPKMKEPNQQAYRAVSCGSDDGLENGKPQCKFLGQASTSLEHCMDSHTVNVKAHMKQQISVGTEKQRKKVPMRQLIHMGKLKPGKDALTFQLQDYSHKGTLLPDGRIKACSGQIHRDVSCWIKAILGNNISVSWKYVANKVTYCGKKLISFMAQEDFAPKELTHPCLQSQTASFSNLRNPMHTLVQIKDILLLDKSDFFPSHLMDQIWDEFLNSDELDL